MGINKGITFVGPAGVSLLFCEGLPVRSGLAIFLKSGLWRECRVGLERARRLSLVLCLVFGVLCL